MCECDTHKLFCSVRMQVERTRARFLQPFFPRGGKREKEESNLPSLNSRVWQWQCGPGVCRVQSKQVPKKRCFFPREKKVP